MAESQREEEAESQREEESNLTSLFMRGKQDMRGGEFETLPKLYIDSS